LACSVFASLAEEFTVSKTVVWDNDPDDIAPLPLAPMLDIDDLAALFNCHRRTIWREIHRGRLPAEKVAGVWRIRREVAAAYLRGGAAS
jgi:excisionase family DNA binding protein